MLSLNNTPNHVMKNVSLLCYEYGIHRHEIVGSLKPIRLSASLDNQDADAAKGTMIREMLEMRFDDPADRANIREIIEHLCID